MWIIDSTDSDSVLSCIPRQSSILDSTMWIIDSTGFRFSPELYFGFQIPGFRIHVRTALHGVTSPSGNYQDFLKWAPGWS